MSAGLAALLDDVAVLARAAAASVDDVAAGASRASVKAAGVIVDDAAVTPRYVQGFRPERELPMIQRIAVKKTASARQAAPMAMSSPRSLARPSMRCLPLTWSKRLPPTTSIHKKFELTISICGPSGADRRRIAIATIATINAGYHAGLPASFTAAVASTTMPTST